MRFLQILIVTLAILIVGIFVSGGFLIETPFGKVRFRTLSNPVLIQSSLFIVWIFLSSKLRPCLRFFLNFRNTLGWFGMVLGSLGLALWIWDFYHPERVWEHLSGRELHDWEWRSLKNAILFWTWAIQHLWIFLSWLRSKQAQEPLNLSLSRVVRGLSLLVFMLLFIRLEASGADIEYRFLAFSALIGGVGFALGWGWPIVLIGKDRSRIVLGVAIVFFTFLFIFLCLRRFNNFRVYEDFPMFVQALWATLHGKWMAVTGWVFPGEGRNFFGHHFQPFLLMLLPLYAFFSSPKFLVVLNVLGFTLAALPLYGLVRERLRHSWLALAFAFAFLHSPLAQRATMHDFHPENFVPLFFFSAFYFLKKPRPFWHGFFCLLVLSLREDCFIHVCVLGLYAVIFERKWKLGLVDLFMGLGWALLSFEWVIPGLRADTSHVFGKYFAHFEAEGLHDLLVQIATSPGVVWDFLTRKDAWVGMLLFSVPLAFLPWLSLRGLFLITAFNLEFFLSSSEHIRSLDAAYAFFILPVYFLAAIVTAERMINGRWLKEQFRSRLCKAWTACLWVVVPFFNFFFRPIDLEGYAPVDHDVLIYGPLGQRFRSNYYADTPHAKLGREMLKKVPEGASLTTQVRFATHLANRFIARILLYSKVPPKELGTEYVFMDLFKDPIRYWEVLDYRFLADLLKNSSYGVVFFRDGYLLLKDGYTQGRNSAVMRRIFQRYGAKHFRSNVGRSIPDPEAYDGWAWKVGWRRKHPGFLIYERYWDIPHGRYRAIFSLKTAHVNVKEEVAGLSVTGVRNGHRVVLVDRKIHGTDFYFDHAYQDFVLPLDIQDLKGVEFRVAYTGHGTAAFGGLTLWPIDISDEEIYRFLRGES